MYTHHILKALIMGTGLGFGLGLGLGGAATPALAEGTEIITSLPQNTRVMSYHVYEDRQQARGLVTPRGYRPAWDDGRLNPQRGITTLKPTGSGRYGAVPSGYKRAWEDRRLDTTRGQVTARGNAQTDQIWSQTVPRVLLPAALPKRLYGGPTPRKEQQTPVWETR